MVPNRGSRRPPIFTRVFVSSIVSGYSTLRTLIALLKEKVSISFLRITKRTKRLCTVANSLHRRDDIHFLWSQNTKLHLQHIISRLFKHQKIIFGSSTSSTRRRGAEDCAFAANKLAMVLNRRTRVRLTATRRAALFREDGLLWVP